MFRRTAFTAGFSRSGCGMFRSTAALFGILNFKLADIGEAIDKAEVLKWSVKEGDSVGEMDHLCDVQSDKATVDITSPVKGKIVKIHFPVGTNAIVGKVLCDIETDAEAGGSVSAPQAPAKAAPAKAATPAAPATPAAATSSTPSTGILNFKLADIGEAIDKAEVLKWSVKEGDSVGEMDHLCDVQSDKATVDITSPVKGKIVKIHFPVGTHAIVGKVLCDIETDSVEDGSGASATATPAATAAPASSTPRAASAQPQRRGGRTLMAPSVRRLVAENGLDISQIPATGSMGHVTKSDVLAYMKSLTAPFKPPVVEPTPQKIPTFATPAPATAGTVRREPITGMKKAMVTSMTKALAIPSFGACDEININRLIATRDELRSEFLKRDPTLKLSFMPFFLKAASLALLEFPIINAHTNDDCTEILYHSSHNVGFAMDTPAGLAVPNIKNVQEKSIYQIALDLRSLMERGSKSAFKPDDLKGGTFTLSNIGSIGATYTAPVIFPPQVAIGALGRGVETPKFGANGELIKATIVNVSWAADHRVIDGATMVRFGNKFKDLLERPSLIMLDTK